MKTKKYKNKSFDFINDSVIFGTMNKVCEIMYTCVNVDMKTSKENRGVVPLLIRD